MKPWDLIPALTEERLVRVADILRRARDSAARQRKVHLGDKLCSVGILAYERSCHALTVAAAKEYRDWLSVGFEDNHFVVRIGGIPLRYFPSDPEADVPARTLEIGDVEKLSTTSVLDLFGMAGVIKCLRIEVTKTRQGFTDVVSFTPIDLGEERIHVWPIPKHVSKKTRQPRKGAVKLDPISLDDPNVNPSTGEATA